MIIVCYSGGFGVGEWIIGLLDGTPILRGYFAGVAEIFSATIK